jgi:hypothetical protein
VRAAPQEVASIVHWLALAPNATPGETMHTDPRSRRSFLRTIALGGTVVLVPGLMTACKKDGDGGGPVGPGLGGDLDIDFARGDVALLQFMYAYEQLNADYYLHVVPFLDDGAYTDPEQILLTDVKYHHVMHREYLKAALGGDGDFELDFDYGSLDFNNRSAFLATGRTLELLGIAMYNGLAQYFTTPANLVTAAKMASVKARHAAALGIMIDPSANAFAPRPYEDVNRIATSEAAMQAFIEQDIQVINAPATFAPGPNGNG